MSGQTTITRPPPLLDLLGASFVFSAPITSLVWDGPMACVGLVDGAIAMLRAGWPGAPALVPRPGGGVEIKAGAAPPPPPHIIAAHRDSVLSLARIPSGGIVSGGADGRFLRIVEAVSETIADHSRKPVTHVAAGRGRRCAMVAGRQIDLAGPDARRIAVPGAMTALTYDPSGLNLAIGHDAGVMLAIAGVRRVRSLTQTCMTGSFAWSTDGDVLAAATDHALEIWRIGGTDPQRRIELEATPDAIGLVAGGTPIAAIGTSLLCWPHETRDEPVICRTQSAPITALACHPRLPIIACGDSLGAIVLCQPASGGTIVIRADGSAIRHLTYSPDGESLAFTATDNEAGVVALPDLLFRTGNHP